MNILLAADRVTSDSPSVKFSKKLLARIPDAALLVLYVTDERPHYQSAAMGLAAPITPVEQLNVHDLKVACEEAFASWENRVQFKNVIGYPATQICAVAKEQGSDLLILGPGISGKMHLGSVGREVLTHAPCSVILAK